MNSFFNDAFAELHYREGDASKDHAGETRFGITLACLKDLPLELADFDHDGKITEWDVLLIDITRARKIYEYLWQKWGLDSITRKDIAVKFFSLCVNSYIVQATQIVQRALYACGYELNKSKKGIDFDGIFGGETLAALNNVEVIVFIPAFREAWAGFCRGLVIKNPALYTQYIEGWLKRAYDRPY